MHLTLLHAITGADRNRVRSLSCFLKPPLDLLTQSRKVSLAPRLYGEVALKKLPVPAREDGVRKSMPRCLCC